MSALSRFALAALAVSAAPLAGAAEMVPDGALNYTVNVGYVSSKKFYDADGDRQDIGCHAKYGDWSHSFEYGYSKYYTLLAGAALGVINCDGEGDSGLDEIKLGFRSALRAPPDAKAKSTLTVQAAIPANPDARRDNSASQLSCGTFGMEAMLEHTRQLGERGTVGYNAGLVLNETPLAHQGKAGISLARILSPRWGMTMGLSGSAPITEMPDPSDAVFFRNALVAQCGTASKSVNATLGLARKLAKNSQAGCGGAYTVWGEDTVQSLGVFCSYSFTWAGNED